MLICEACGVSFQPKPPSVKRKYCSRECYWAVGAAKPRKATVKWSRRKTAKGHPVATASGLVTVSRMVLYDTIGPGPHQCYWCGDQVAWMVGGGPGTPGNLLADHLDWDTNNNDPENLVPSCNHCNAHRLKNEGRAPLRDDELTVMWGGARTRAVQRYCNHCGKEFLTVPAEVRKGKGRYCSRSCARRVPR